MPTTMALTQEEMARLTELSRLALSPQEGEKMRHELDRVLGYVDRLQNIDTSSVVETMNEASSALRPDVVTANDPETRTLIIENFPDRAGDALRVPAVFEKPKG